MLTLESFARTKSKACLLVLQSRNSFIISYVGQCNVQFNLYFCRQAGMQTICFHFRLVQFPNSDDNTNFQHICHGHSKAKKTFDKKCMRVSLRELLTRKSHLANSCTLRKTSQNMGWGLPGNPLDTLSQQQVEDRWMGIAGRPAPAEFLPRFALSLSELHKQTKKKEKGQIGKKESTGLTKGWCWCWTVSQAASRPALQWSIPSQDCNVVPLSWLQPGGDNIAVIMITRLMIIITIITVWLLSSSVLSLVSRLSTCICTHCTLCTPHTVPIFTLFWLTTF